METVVGDAGTVWQIFQRASFQCRRKSGSAGTETCKKLLETNVPDSHLHWNDGIWRFLCPLFSKTAIIAGAMRRWGFSGTLKTESFDEDGALPAAGPATIINDYILQS
ncbi:hypothetical protein [Neisseria iguanae]|uniref:Uncharacterized protein n=1 Tax=Neisseria iguanae TaxID=90242 RepID=A0A2P7U078_9NEIS|nr:hypothetical protein [Neisseria iguanae]PSJ80390.1 hypothetical protein C7N83_06455 [Neisseria iguanae]